MDIHSDNPQYQENIGQYPVLWRTMELIHFRTVLKKIIEGKFELSEEFNYVKYHVPKTFD